MKKNLKKNSKISYEAQVSCKTLDSFSSSLSTRTSKEERGEDEEE